MVWAHEVAGSSPVIPTKNNKKGDQRYDTNTNTKPYTMRGGSSVVRAAAL